MATVRIDARFRGPPQSGNGGYVAGVVAQAFGGTGCEVTLHRPPPLDRDLDLDVSGDRAALTDAGTLLASAFATSAELQPPRAPTVETALAAEKGYKGFGDHVFPTCFVCGPQRAHGDGLRIFAATVPGESAQVAAHWRPADNLGDADGLVRSEFLWAALDCPGYFAVDHQSGPAVLGRLAADIVRRPPVDEPVVVTGWAIGHDGRKHIAGTALHDREGALIAVARAVWVSLKR